LATFSASRSAYNSFQHAMTTRPTPRRGANKQSRSTAPVAPVASSSSSPVSWTKVEAEGRDTKQGEGSMSTEKFPAHPAPGSDVDALEP
jgi:hypothetical protein